MPSEVVKTRKIISSVKTALTEEEVIAYIIEGMKRDHKDLKDYEMGVDFAWDAHAASGGADECLTATVSGERVG